LTPELFRMAKPVHPVDAMRAVLALALLASLSSCKKKAEDTVSKAPPPPPVKVPLVVATEAPAPDLLTLTGMIAADQRSEVTADTQGKVVAVLVERGQRVKMGEPVVRLDVRTAALSAREAQANLESARAQKRLAEEECKRAQTLLDKGAITRSEYDRQSTQCTSSLQQVSAAQARADLITKSIADGLVRAPFDGVVTEKSVVAGEWVAPGRTLFTLVDDDPLKIELSVPEAAVRAIQMGQKVELVAVAFPDKTFSATITRIGGEIGRSRSLIVEATVERRSREVQDDKGGRAAPERRSREVQDDKGGRAAPERRSREVQDDKGGRATPDPQKELVPGMFAEAHVVIGQTPRPVLPAEALVKRGKTWHAFVAVKGELQDHIVQVGPSPEPGKVSILQGVTKGDKVVAKISDQIIDGLRVIE
jgi:membrane fusion protein (multidrug efflux system)